ncbi:hypothetical protein HY78_18635 [Rhizorhabdus wittichii DC-6]|nr:hypothetical protein HY78_18635 [Rhizorhabdus wittichii DC-6]
MDKKTCYIQVSDIKGFKAAVDQAMGYESLAGRVQYTGGSNRGHFLKSVASDSQDEYRFVWPVERAREHPPYIEIELPPGFSGEIIDL